MQNLSDTALLHHLADRHRLPTQAERAAHILHRDRLARRLGSALAVLQFRAFRPKALHPAK